MSVKCAKYVRIKKRPVVQLVLPHIQARRGHYMSVKLPKDGYAL